MSLDWREKRKNQFVERESNQSKKSSMGGGVFYFKNNSSAFLENFRKKSLEIVGVFSAQQHSFDLPQTNWNSYNISQHLKVNNTSL